MSLDDPAPKFPLGQIIHLAAVFTTPVGAPSDPSDVTFGITAPGGVETVYVFGTDAELVRTGVGLYHVDWPSALEGEHCWGFLGTGTAQAMDQSKFEIEERCFPIEA